MAYRGSARRCTPDMAVYPLFLKDEDRLRTKDCENGQCAKSVVECKARRKDPPMGCCNAGELVGQIGSEI
eukprot:1590728-Amphidinium_carterae.3